MNCAICWHPQKAEMEAAIASGSAIEQAAEHFGVAFASLWAHCQNHVYRPAAAEAELNGEAEERCLDDMERLAADALAFLSPWALTPGSLRIMERRERQIALRSKLAMNQKSADPTLDLAASREWQDLKARLLLTLERFPDAYQAMVEALADPPSNG